VRLALTPSQTAGPFLAIGLPWADGPYVVPEGTPGAIVFDGQFRVITLRPGGIPGPDGGIQAPHIDVSVFARGLLDRLVTRIYFSDEPAANEADPVLRSIADPARRATLIAVARDGRPGGFGFDIRRQGERETVFFDV